MIFQYLFYFCAENISIVRHNINLNSPKKVSHLKKYGIYYFGCAGVLIIIAIIIIAILREQHKKLILKQHKELILKQQAVNAPLTAEDMKLTYLWDYAHSAILINKHIEDIKKININSAAETEFTEMYNKEIMNENDYNNSSWTKRNCYPEEIKNYIKKNLKLYLQLIEWLKAGNSPYGALRVNNGLYFIYMADKVAEVKVDENDKTILANGQIQIKDLITNNYSQPDKANDPSPIYSDKIRIDINEGNKELYLKWLKAIAHKLIEVASSY